MKTTRAGFSLIEVVFALGIAAVSLVSVLGLLPIGLNSSLSATSQTCGINVLTAVAADLRNIPVAASGMVPKSPVYGLSLDTNSTLYFNQGGGFDSNRASNSRYRVSVTPVVPSGPSKCATTVSIVVSWPAAASVNNALGTVDACISLDRN